MSLCMQLYSIYSQCLRLLLLCDLFFFFFNDTATTEIYTLSLHDALPISVWSPLLWSRALEGGDLCLHHAVEYGLDNQVAKDRKSTRLNSSHVEISYAVFCLKKKKN